MSTAGNRPNGKTEDDGEDTRGEDRMRVNFDMLRDPTDRKLSKDRSPSTRPTRELTQRRALTWHATKVINHLVLPPNDWWK